MPLLTEILGALVGGALVVVIARQLGAEPRRAFAAAMLVVVGAAVVIAAPRFREDIDRMRAEHDKYAPLSSTEAAHWGGIGQGVDVEFLEWARERMGEGETFHLEIGAAAGERTFEGSGLKQQAALAWGTYQLGPHISVEQAGGFKDLEKGEGRNADWIVFYEMDPKKYPVQLQDVMTYAPNFAIGKTVHAG